MKGGSEVLMLECECVSVRCLDDGEVRERGLIEEGEKRRVGGLGQKAKISSFIGHIPAT